MGYRDLETAGLSRPIFFGLAAFALILAGAHLAAGSPGPLRAPGATPYSVTLSWTAPGDDSVSGTASQYDIRYSLLPITDADWDQATQVAGEPVPQQAGSAESFEVAGLEPNTLYYFAVRAADEVPNWSSLSNVVSRSTDPEDTPPSAIADLITENPSPSSMSLRWTAPGDDGDAGTASEYDIRYSTSYITDADWASATQITGEPSPQAAGNIETFTVTSLNPGTTYYFAMKTADEVPNWSLLSNVATGVTTEEATVPPAPVLVSPDHGASDLIQPITLDWEDISDIDWYQVQVDELSYFESPVVDSNLAASTCAVSGLADGTTYFWRVRAHNDAGWGEWSSVWGFITACPVPDVPLLAAPDNGAINLNQPIVLDWNDVADATQYQIQVDDLSSFAAPEINVSPSVSGYSASGLDEGQTYYWRVRADNACGWSDWSAVWSFATRDNTIPDAITDLNAAPGQNNGEVTLTWTATGDDGAVGTASQYDVRYSIVEITPQNWGNASLVSGEPSPQPAGSSESFTIGNLDPNQKYYFAIKVADEAGNLSGLSNVVSTMPRDLTPPAPIQDLSADTGPDIGEIYLSWTAPGDDGYNGIASAYLLKYSRQMINDENWEAATIYGEFITPLASGQVQEFIMAGLEPGENYYIGIKAYDDQANGSELSNIVSCAAGFDWVVDVDDEELQPVSPSPDAAVHSSHPTLAVTNAGTQGSYVYYFEVAADSFYIDVVAASPPILQEGGDITLWRVDERLDPGKKYFWRARANDNSYCATSSFTVHPEPHAYPNPFNMSSVAEVRFAEVPDGSDVVLLSASGTTVRQWSNVSENDLTWDGTNESGNAVASGT
jgi:hypothetical protein